jgi:hypothetical protein|nr:MAG TPA: N-6 DNA Methylase [Caudoviricetes sp.]
MKEFNNRNIADKFAEYITGQELRKYLAEKVRKYVGEDITVFDGAVGSGQLEQHIKPKWIYGVEIQKNACDVFKENYPNSDISNISFFNYESDVKADCIVMNYPFSLKFKELEEDEQKNIQKDFSFKKSGVVDDIFILKSLKYSKRFGFYICFPGIAYRKTEEQFRKILKNAVKELNIIENAFEDTSIPVLFLIIDKEKTDIEVIKEIYDCKTKSTIHHEICKDVEDSWRIPVKEQEKEIINIVEIEKEIAQLKEKRRRVEDELDKFIETEIKGMD